MVRAGACVWVVLSLLACSVPSFAQLNRPPQFLPGGDMARFALPEGTPVGAPVYRLQGVDPEGAGVRYSISGEHLTVDRQSGVVTLLRPLDRESSDLMEVIISITGESAVSLRYLVELPDCT